MEPGQSPGLKLLRSRQRTISTIIPSLCWRNGRRTNQRIVHRRRDAPGACVLFQGGKTCRRLSKIFFRNLSYICSFLLRSARKFGILTLKLPIGNNMDIFDMELPLGKLTRRTPC